ncbi:hypothetical protein MRB53_035549 [Persea americana]|uniref:Uncharacterized protein n=1 Tax=Persea americana TaxID=3435 RepID=A0ACC2K597_PERAE|nr:hypothetical protein MRB53_035549 [Persea americana]
MAQSNWEADKMLDVYIYDYLLKRNLHDSAKAFMAEGKVSGDPVAIDAPGGFLFEWWSVFWDIFIARTNEKHSEKAAAYIEAHQIKAREQHLQMRQLQIIQQRQAQLQRRDASNPSISGPINAILADGMLGQSTASVLAAKRYEERMKHPHSMDSEPSPQLLEANRMALLRSASNHPDQLVQSNPSCVSAALQQIRGQTDLKADINSTGTQRSLPMDPSSLYSQGVTQSKSGLGNGGLNQGGSGLPLKGWPLGIDQVRPSLGSQLQKPFVQTPNQFQLLSLQQQRQFLQAQARGSSVQACSPKVRVDSQDQEELTMKMQQSSTQQQPDRLQLQHLQQNNRKRKHSASGAANSTGTGNTMGPSPNSQPSTPSTHTPGDGVAVVGSLQRGNNPPKSLTIYGPDGSGGLASSTDQLDDMEHFGDVGSLEDNVDSFLSHDGGDARDTFGTLKRSPTKNTTESSKGFSFNEVSCIRTSNGKVVSCHFSSDGKLLASAGHEKKAVIWNMDTLETVSTPEEHSLTITDIRFRMDSTQLATSSFDRTVRLWNAAEPNYCLHAYSGHGSPVMSLDFHPKKTDLFCSCDNNGGIRYWNASQYSCSRVSKGGIAQVRFQPRVGQFLAAAAENVVSIFDVESDRKTYSLQGHTKVVHSVCWDAKGDYLASVSHDSVRVWSLASGGECIHELIFNGNNFKSCVFHPSYSTLLVIGGDQSLELWNMAENKSMTIPAHDGLIVALAQSPVTGMVASASHDKSVKLWK